MSEYPDTNLSFGAGQFRLLLQSDRLRAPRPRPATGGLWVHVPYGGNKYEWDGTFEHTVWTPSGGILIPTPDDWTGGVNTNYTAIEALYGRTAALVTPWGTFTARLAQLDVARSNDDSYEGAASWEWA